MRKKVKANTKAKKSPPRKSRAGHVLRKPRPAAVEELDFETIHVSPKGVVQWAHLCKDEIVDGKDTGKRSLTVVFDPSKREDAKFIEAMEAAQVAGKEVMLMEKKDASKVKGCSLMEVARPQIRKNEEGELIETGLVTMRFRSKYPPEVRDVFKNSVDRSNVTWGSEVVVAFSLVPFAMTGQRVAGASLRLHEVGLIKKGQRLSCLEDVLEKYANAQEDEDE